MAPRHLASFTVTGDPIGLLILYPINISYITGQKFYNFVKQNSNYAGTAQFIRETHLFNTTIIMNIIYSCLLI